MKSTVLINRIEDHRHDKIKTRQINMFEHLYFKKYGYHHKFTRGSENFDNISHVTLSGHSQNLPSSSSNTTFSASSTSTTPAAPMAPAPTSTVAPSHTCTRPSHTCINSTDNTNRSGSSISPTPPLLQCKNHYWQEAKTLP